MYQQTEVVVVSNLKKRSKKNIPCPQDTYLGRGPRRYVCPGVSGCPPSAFIVVVPRSLNVNYDLVKKRSNIRSIPMARDAMHLELYSLSSRKW